MKGGDYTRDQVVGHEIVEAGGGEVMLVDVLPGFSTTSLVDRARGRQGVSIGAATSSPARRCRSWRDPAAWVKTADICAILIALSLPWSTSLVAIFAARAGS